MRIAVNTRLLISGKLDGIGWFTFENLKRICQNHPGHQFYFLFDRPFAKEFIFTSNIQPIVIGPPARHPVLWYFWFEWQLPKILKKIKPDVFLSTDGYLPLNSQVKSVSVIHDLNFVHYPNDLPWASRLYYNYFFRKFAHKATRIATVSEYSKQDIIKSYGIHAEKTDVVYNGYNPIYQSIDKESQQIIKNQISKGWDYFVFIGSLHPRKNVAKMLKAFEMFRIKSGKRMKFIIIGQKFFKTGDINKTLNHMKYREDVVFTGHMQPNEIRDILASAIALVLVSKFEGFGIPVIEALKCATPVIVSDVTSLPEIASDAGLYANPFSVSSIADAMYKITENEQLRMKLIQNGEKVINRFNWDKTANHLWECIVKAYG
jgi:glycosyltransferase involved in cell wall biosynthesis